MSHILTLLRYFSEQILNSLWSFLAMRLIVSNTSLDLFSKASVSLTIAYSLSAAIRAKFVFPLYQLHSGDIYTRNEEIKSILNSILPKMMILLIGLSHIFNTLFTHASGLTVTSLGAFVVSIIILDVVRATSQLTGMPNSAIFLNLVGFSLFLGASQILWSNSQIITLSEALFPWTLSNSIFTILLLLLNKVSFSNSINKLPNENKSETSRVHGNTLLAELIFSRVTLILGQVLLLRIDNEQGQLFIFALFVFSTIPFSALNGITPGYVRYKMAISTSSLIQYKFGYRFHLLVFIIMSPTLMVIICHMYNSEITASLFGNDISKTFHIFPIIFVLTLIKVYDSLRTTFFLSRVGARDYLNTKFVLNLGVNLVIPLCLINDNTLLVFILSLYFLFHEITKVK